MHQLPISQRLEKQRTLREWLQWQLNVADRTIRELEAEEREQQRRREVARAEMMWKLQPARAVEGHPMLHRGGCRMGKGMGLLGKDEVITAFQEFPDLEMCEICNPWGSLGIDRPPPARKLPGGGTP
ncbi:hypothetical protein GPZ77_34340 (plasmid) [Streptomyces sp. QHH-9511]|uniref:DUF6233 domain-containing protein n=1 Tax=Streptomyces sp. QHH-9511 TaxID=2684468 RepID=UPI001315CD61|nr:DUF6233 domain-containing protein [Streptomyces sp. QHH-9511]QGZ53312.1 hypothetical protein GPZ77_34340 [Streptomyces sp. QHH-9511]